MSELLLKQAAVIRDETGTSANTAERVGLCLEGIIREHDDFASRFPTTRIPPLVIDISQLDAMTTTEFARGDDRCVGTFFIVTRTGIQGTVLVIGTLEIFSDDMRHVVTQIFKTHEHLSADERFTAGHDHNHIYVYTRSYGLTMGSQTAAGPSCFPLHGWGKWRPLTAIPPQEGDEQGMAGLMSAEDKGLLDALAPLELTQRGTAADDWPALYNFSGISSQKDFEDFFAVHPMLSIYEKAKAGASIFMRSKNGETVFVRMRSFRPAGSKLKAVFEFDNIVLTISVSTARSEKTYKAVRVDMNKTFVTL